MSLNSSGFAGISHDVKTVLELHIFEGKPQLSPFLPRLGIVCLFADDNALYFTDRCQDFFVFCIRTAV